MWCLICGVVTLAFLIKIICAMHSNANQCGRNADSRIVLSKEEYDQRKAEDMLLLVYLGIFHIVNFFELVACIISYAVPDNLFALWEIYAVLSPVSAALVPNCFMMMLVCCKFYREDIHSAKELWRNCCKRRDPDAEILTPSSSTISA